MRSHVEFVSDAFPPYPGEEEKINPGIWGQRLAEFLVAKLPEHGINASRFYLEDWGCFIRVKNEAFPMAIGCANYGGCGSGSEENGFLCFIDPHKPNIRRWLVKKVNTVRDVERVADALDKVLRGHPQIREIRWWSEDEVT